MSQGQSDIEIILDMDIAEIAEQEEMFKTELCTDLSQPCKAHAEEMRVLDLQSGSIKARIRLNKNVSVIKGRNSLQVAEELCKQVQSAQSNLFV